MFGRQSAVLVGLTAGGSLLLFSTAADAQCVEGCTAIHTLVGEAAGDQFGWVSNSIGDVDDDGVEDMVLTAPTNDAGGSNAGRIYVHSGASGNLIFHVTGEPNWRLGYDATGAGDINGDGTPDVIVGAPLVGNGRARIVSGVDGSTIHQFEGEALGDQFGFRVNGGGDFNGDGTPDLIVGAPFHDAVGSNGGRAYVYSGSTFNPLCTLDGPTAGDNFGSGVTFIGDINGDGRDDICIGARHAGSGGGMAYVYTFDPLNIPPCEFAYEVDPGPGALDFGQWFMNGGHDVDGDSIPDFYVNDYSINRAHVFSGVDGSEIYVLNGDGNGQFGIGRMIPDINNDDRADFILAAWISGAGASQAGKAFVYSGIDGTVLETFTHNIAGAGFGFDANGMGDVDGDGKYDYLITAAQDNANAGRGISYVIAGNIGGSIVGDLDNDGDVDTADLLQLLAAWGPCAKCVEDLDGDGDVDTGDLLMLLAAWT